MGWDQFASCLRLQTVLFQLYTVADVVEDMVLNMVERIGADNMVGV